MANLGYTNSDQTVGNILKRHHMVPDRELKITTTWEEFIRTHMDVLVATDFFTTEVWTLGGLVTYYVLFFVHLGSRKVHIAGVTPHPNQAWMMQIARNVTMEQWGFLSARQYLIHDRDGKYGPAFQQLIDAAGVERVPLPPRSPNLNAHAERWVRSVKEGCLARRMILFGEASLHHALTQYVEHFHAERLVEAQRVKAPFSVVNDWAGCSNTTNERPHEFFDHTTGAYSDVVFGLFRLLGYQFCPRLADMGGARLWRIDPSADYGPLNRIARHRINMDLIARHWDDLLRLAGSLKLGLVQATAMMRTLQVGDRPTRLAQAVAEFGRIDKTLHILSMMDDESKRRRTLHQLNRGEERHKLARVVFHGKRGELRQHYREGQEDQLGALGLVVNIIVLWNTLYIDAALEQLRREGYPVEPTDVARLSPLCFEHINLLGRYARSRNPWPAVPCAPYGSQVIRWGGNADALSRFSVPLFPNTQPRGQTGRPGPPSATASRSPVGPSVAPFRSSSDLSIGIAR